MAELRLLRQGLLGPEWPGHQTPAWAKSVVNEPPLPSQGKYINAVGQETTQHHSSPGAIAVSIRF
ncbi:hypothetical protein BBP40_010136 [Aspergillus hancockii]|nr:hypothetical protein BBP40_010136 [Aspergillus hancockii]